MIKVRICFAPRSQPFDESVDSLYAAIRYAESQGFVIALEKIRGGAPGFQNYGMPMAHLIGFQETHLFVAADDVIYPQDAIVRLVNADKDIICGIYRKNILKEIQPANYGDGTSDTFLQRLREGGIYEAQFTCAHSLTIRREVLEKMMLDYPELAYKQNGLVCHALFLPMVCDGECYQDDWAFSIRAKQSGFKMWDDFGCQLKHYCADFLGFEALQ